MLNAHRPEIEQFVSALFRYADEGSFVSLRAFDQFDRGRPAVLVRGVRIGSDLQDVVREATSAAEHTANLDFAAVFAPPVATFTNASKATAGDVANGVAISVEVDQGDARVAQRRLEALLGPVTMVVASGGEWADPATGQVHPKLHLHWRLSEPTATPAGHARLRQARWLAAVLVDADRTAAPPVHPLRWPGSWNRKAHPRMAMTAGGNPDAELHLSDALAALEEAVEAAGLDINAGPRVSSNPQANADLIASAMAAIPNADVSWDDWVRIGMAAWRATGGSDEGLTAWEAWSAKSCKHVLGACDERWSHFSRSPPERIGAGTLFFLAAKEGWQRPYRMFEDRSSREEAPDLDPDDPGPDSYAGHPGHSVPAWGRPIDFFTDQNRAVPALLPDHVPPVIYSFAVDTAERMGVDPFSVALGSLVAAASVMTDDWRIQPKRHDYEWTEQPRLWAATVGDPSIKKSPQLAACTKPIDKLDAEARRRHQEAMRTYKRDLKEFKRDQTGDVPEPTVPKLDRYLIEGATVEAISEVLRDDDDALQRAPAKKVLSRHDEMSEFFGNLDRYKTGGKGGGDRGSYLRLFNGGRYTIDRIGRGAFSVPNWSACFLGGIQPGPIQRVAKDTADDGLLQRFVYAVPGPQKQGLDRSPCAESTRNYAALFPAIVALSPPATPGGEHHQVVKLHQDGHRDREDVDRVAVGMSLLHNTSPRLQSALGKWPGLFARLCLIFHLIEIADARAREADQPYLLVVSPDTTAMVARFMCELVMPHLLRADALMFRTEQSNHVERIAGWIVLNRLSQVRIRDVVRNYKPLSAPEHRQELSSIMEMLVMAHWLEPEPSANPARSTNVWSVNPSVHDLFGDYAALEAARREGAREAIKAARTIKAGRSAERGEE